MRVLVTGATGFIGGWTARTLLEGGHDVRLLVRDPGRLPPDLRRREAVVGDVTDETAVRSSVIGCDAVVHAAALVATERRRIPEMQRTNVEGTRNVLGSATRAGLDPVVYVSSVSALFAPGVPLLHPELPAAVARSGYGRSKADAEREARRLQEEGYPVTITYPGGVLGPPIERNFGEAAEGLALMLRWGFVPLAAGAWLVVDVRDVAALHGRAMEAGKGPRRFMCGGHFLSMRHTAEILRDLTGRAFPVLPVPPGVLRATGRAVDAIMRVVPVRSPLTSEAMSYLTRLVPSDDASTRSELGLELRPAEDTIADAVRALVVSGRVSPARAGRLAPDGPPGGGLEGSS